MPTLPPTLADKQLVLLAPTTAASGSAASPAIATVTEDRQAWRLATTTMRRRSSRVEMLSTTSRHLLTLCLLRLGCHLAQSVHLTRRHPRDTAPALWRAQPPGLGPQVK